LTGDDSLVVVGVHERESLARRDLVRARRRLGQRLAGEHRARAEGLRAAHLRERRVLGHHDRRGNAEPRGLIRDGLRVVACRHRDHAALAFRRRQLQEAVRGAAIFERRGTLPRLELQRDARARLLRKRRREERGRADDRRRDALGCGFDVGDRHGQGHHGRLRRRSAFSASRAAKDGVAGIPHTARAYRNLTDAPEIAHR